MSDASSFLVSPESPTTSSPSFDLVQRSDTKENYPLEAFENTNAGGSKSDSEGLLESALCEQYDERQIHIVGAPDEEEHEPSRAGHGLLWSSHKRLTTPQSITQSILRWMRGPDPPRIYRIRSSEWLQGVSSRLIDKHLSSRRRKVFALTLVYLLWAVVFLLLLRASVTGDFHSGDGPPLRLSCTSRLWYVARLSRPEQC